MSTRTCAAVAALAVLAASASASAAADAGPAARTGQPTFDLLVPQAHRSVALPDYLRHAGTAAEVQRAVRSWQVDAAAALGVPTETVLAAQAAAAPVRARTRLVRAQEDGVVIVSGTASISMSLLQPAADLDGDGVRDLLDVRYAGSGSGSAHVATAARSGTTGRVLWHRVDAMPAGHFVLPIAVAVGKPARPGVVLLDNGIAKTGSSSIEVTDRFTALAGRTGARLWQHGDKGALSFENGMSGKHVPSWYGFLQMTAGAKDLLLTFTDFDEGDSGESGSVTPYRLNGATGVAAPSGAPVASGDSIPTVSPLGDVSGDGRDDYAVLVGGTSSSVQARRAVDGAAVWADSSMPLYPGAYAQSAGPLTGGRLEDVAVVSGTPTSSLPTVGTPVGDVSDPSTPPHGKVGLLRGDTGASVWQQTGDGAFRVLRAGPAHLPALGVTTADTTNDVNGTTETLHLMAYDVAGTQLYDQTYTLQAPADAQDNYGFGFAAAWVIGDFGPDGARDGWASMFAFNGGNVRSRSFLFDGASGTALPGKHEALYGSVDGRGDDLVDVSAAGSVLVTALRGGDQKRVFATRLRPASSMQEASASAERVVGRCGDVLVTATGKSASYAAVLTAAGKVRWSIEHGTRDLRPGAAKLGPAGTRAVCA